MTLERGRGQRPALRQRLLPDRTHPLLGHHVVGALASRLGAHVELRPTAGSGVTAYVALPAVLATEGAVPAAAATT